MLCDGAPAITNVPSDRWDVEHHCRLGNIASARDGYSYTCAGSWLSGAHLFDFGFFGIARAEAAHMDPKQRLLLEVGYSAFHAAGLGKPELLGSDTGVFVGMCSQEPQR